MASAKAWGTITIVDAADIGQFSVTPSSNRATTVIYTPDNNTYTPNWAETSGNVTITPVVYYGGTQLNPGIAAASNPKVTWTYKTNAATSFTTLPSWATAQSNGTLKLTGNPFTTSSISSVTFKCTANYNEPATNLPLTAAGEITYSVVRQAASVYVGVISTPNGNVFSNGAGSLLITAQLYLGSDDVTSASSFQWAKFSGSAYTDLQGKTSSTLTVDGDDVNGLASYRCTISHNSAVRAVLYATLIDKTDPIQAEILSTAGDKFVNGVAEGAMYVKVYRNGVEIDPLPTEVISKTAPASPKAGAMYFKIDTATNSVKLMKYVSGAWAEQTYTPTATYTWSYLNKDGEETHPSGMATSGKIVYVDGDFVNVKLTAFCKVEV